MSPLEGDRIALPVARHIRHLPGLPGPDYIGEQSLVASTRSGGTALRDTLDDVDQGCLITNVHKHTDKRAHMVNAQRDDDEEKKSVQGLLIKLGLTHRGFDLDEMSNIAWLDATLHTAFDKYDMFAITLSLGFGENVRKILVEDLAFRQSEMDRTGRLVQRPFQRYTNAEFQVVVLHPDHLLPHGSTLLRRMPDGSYTPYKASSDKLLRQVDPEAILSSDHLPNLTAPPFPPFQHQTSRDILQALNLYFVLLNAEIKFQRFAKNIGLDKLHPDMKAVVEQTMEIVRLMYSQPQRSGACMAETAAREDWSFRERPQGAGAVNYAEDEGEEGAEVSGSTQTHKLPLGWGALSLEQRIALGRDLFSRGSRFRQHSPSEEETETDIPPQPPLLPVPPHHQNQGIDIKGWAEGIL